jgi:hypothetical protein
MSEYDSREHRLVGVTLRMRVVRSSLAHFDASGKQHRSWLARNRGRLAAWPDVLKSYSLLRPSSVPTTASRRFSRWATRQRWTHPALLKLRLECAWLALRVAALDARQNVSTVHRRDAILIVLVLVLLLLFGFTVILFVL